MHLVVLHHGLWGNGDNLETLAQVIADHSPPHVRVLNCRASERTRTLDGVDICGERLIEAVNQKMHGEEKFQQISFIGYSMGGLISQYAIGKLYSSGFFDTIELINFVCLATPRLGAHVHHANNGCSWRDYIFNIIAPIISSRSGFQMFFEDEWAHERPLLNLMADPELPWFKGLKTAKNLINLSNIQFDTMVGYRVSSMLDKSPYEKGRGWFWWWHGNDTKGLKEGYPSIVCPPSDNRGREEWGHPRASVVEGLWFRALALCLLPILLPLILIFLPISLIKGAWHHQTFKLPPDYNAWFTNKKASQEPAREVSANEVDIIVNVAEDRIPPKSRVAHQEWVRDRLKNLPWNQVDVDCRHCWAHASLVVRHPERFKNRDQLLYLVKEAMEW